MGRSRYTFAEADAPHFLTCTVVDWMPVFTRPETVGIVLDSLSFLCENRDLKLYGYVILENHMHLVAQSSELGEDVARLKSFTGKELVKFFKDAGIERIVRHFEFAKRHHKKDRKHQVWQEGSHPQVIADSDVLRQKLEYIHQNPVKRGYVDAPEHWRYSSARNYNGTQGLIDVYQDWK